MLGPDLRALAAGAPLASQGEAQGAAAPALADSRAARAVFDACFLASYEYERYFTKRAEERKKRPGPADLEAVRLFAPGAAPEAVSEAARVAAGEARAPARRRSPSGRSSPSSRPTC